MVLARILGEVNVAVATFTKLPTFLSTISTYKLHTCTMHATVVVHFINQRCMLNDILHVNNLRIAS